MFVCTSTFHYFLIYMKSCDVLHIMFVWDNGMLLSYCLSCVVLLSRLWEISFSFYLYPWLC